ncbi:lysophosphatidic acid receptor 2b isoform X1 [Paramormyrops kingsleyae]|uniref:lysophosphatidic acid receptor 2b isoform X1 n=1 Tax=Paramormyrops kingsleyae TaxID=1676925 RepID=UPI000CD5D2C5|nr:lysophosphatidic acid receptor 2-like isoform X1 [Paramormyrops kingsleyae]XP_023651461.1 lysophosphatidic acid receptor 2-like isoform X1 [Paramormyrops kingsleyae]XP_023651462.1 lysophosphatidic acid receptor 2-like isoform X1 [Paramormyrops kingsleyae]
MDIHGKSNCYYNQTVEFFYSQTGKNISSNWGTRDKVVVGLGLTVSVIVILANILVMTAIIINHRFHYPIYYLLGNLAAADLFAGLAYLHLMFHTGPWTRRLTVYSWFLRQGLIDTSLTASVVNLLAVAVERHQSVFTMQLHSNMSKRRVLSLILGIWLVAGLLGLVPSMGWHCLCHLSDCSKMAPLYRRSYLVFWAVLNLLTFFIMLAVYTRIFVYVRHKSQCMSQHTMQVKHQETVVNLMKTVSMILGAFVICWTPGLVLLLLDGLHCEACQVLRYEKYCLVLAECNSLMNPIIYSYRDQDMRQTFRQILCCWYWRRQRSRRHQEATLGIRFNTQEEEVLSVKLVRNKHTSSMNNGTNSSEMLSFSEG